jgi:Tfp pilus assembly PilM family ATPase
MKIDPQAFLTGRNRVAIEMGGDWFKLVQVTSKGKGAVVSKIILKPAEEVEGLSGVDLMRACGVSGLAGASVIACLPRQMVNVRLFDLPSGDLREIADMIDLQIARQTPYSREEIVYDYRLIDSDREGYTRVMLMIAQSGQVRQRVRVLEDAGFAVDVVAVSTDGWLGAIQNGGRAADGEGGQEAYLDLDSTYGDFIVLQKGLPLFSRSIPIGARDLAADPQKQEEKLAQELARALETFRNENTGGDVRQVVLSGAASWIQGLAERLQAALKIPVTTTRSPVRAGEIPEVPHLQEASVTGLLGAAAMPEGLQINLMPESVSLRKALVVKAGLMTVAVLLGMAILVLLSLWLQSRLQRREVYLAQLNGMIKQTEAAADEVDSMRRKVSLVSARQQTQMMPAKLLVELHDIAGDNLFFSAIEITGVDRMVCRGTANTGMDVGQFVNALESSPRFANVKTTRTVKGKDGVEFEIACDVEKRP